MVSFVAHNAKLRPFRKQRRKGWRQLKFGFCGGSKNIMDRKKVIRKYYRGCRCVANSNDSSSPKATLFLWSHMEKEWLGETDGESKSRGKERERGRQRVKYLSGCEDKANQVNPTQLIGTTEDWLLWHRMVAIIGQWRHGAWKKKERSQPGCVHGAQIITLNASILRWESFD